MKNHAWGRLIVPDQASYCRRTPPKEPRHFEEHARALLLPGTRAAMRDSVSFGAEAELVVLLFNG
ncbi:hypothetical protein ABZ402_35945 [Streptomyces mirabilis]|uniref:hypothetical protein n=1 Tax=Streptomyces mirabilis TaxID=68239 RepID=UPI003406B153